MVFKLSFESNFAFGLVLHYYALELVKKKKKKKKKKLAPLSQPVGMQTKTNRVLAARIFPHFPWRQLHVFASNSNWFTALLSVAIGQSNNFGFGFTTINWKPL